MTALYDFIESRSFEVLVHLFYDMLLCQKTFLIFHAFLFSELCYLYDLLFNILGLDLILLDKLNEQLIYEELLNFNMYSNLAQQFYLFSTPMIDFFLNFGQCLLHKKDILLLLIIYYLQILQEYLLYGQYQLKLLCYSKLMDNLIDSDYNS